VIVTNSLALNFKNEKEKIEMKKMNLILRNLVIPFAIAQSIIAVSLVGWVYVWIR
jgi:hypothetical protein